MPAGAKLLIFWRQWTRAITRAREAPTAILCAEEDPLHCHRFLLICPTLVQKGAVPLHLRRGGVIESQRDAEDRLLQLHGFADVTSDSLFAQGREAALEDALKLQAEQYAFRTSQRPSSISEQEKPRAGLRSALEIEARLPDDRVLIAGR